MRALKIGLAIVLAAQVFPQALAAPNGQSTYQEVTQGRSCKAHAQMLSCEYQVGKDLLFSIDGIGQPDTGITFLRSDFDGDFYATFGMLHGCVIVKRGGASVVDGIFDGPGSFRDYAFVSTRNGKVYRDWRECQAGY